MLYVLCDGHHYSAGGQAYVRYWPGDPYDPDTGLVRVAPMPGEDSTWYNQYKSKITKCISRRNAEAPPEKILELAGNNHGCGV